MAKPKPFLFEYSFDDGADDARRGAEEAKRRAAEEAEANKPPTFTVEEMEAARAESHAQGRQEGMDDAMAGIEQQVARTLGTRENTASKVFEQHKAWTREMEADAVRLAATVMRKLAPELVRNHELPEVETVIREAFGFLTEQPKVMIRVNSDLEAPLSDRVNLMASRVGYEGQVVLVGDPELPIDDCRVSWQAGAVERSLDNVWAQVDQMVDRVLIGTKRRERPEDAPAEQGATPEPVAVSDDVGPASDEPASDERTSDERAPDERAPDELPSATPVDDLQQTPA